MASRLFAGIAACCAKTIVGWQRFRQNARFLLLLATRGRGVHDAECRTNPQPMNDAASLASLERLQAQVHRDLSAIEVPPAEWMRPRQGPDGRRALDVVVVGAGLSGLAIGFGLLRQRIDNILI